MSNAQLRKREWFEISSFHDYDFDNCEKERKSKKIKKFDFLDSERDNKKNPDSGLEDSQLNNNGVMNHHNGEDYHQTPPEKGKKFFQKKKLKKKFPKEKIKNKFKNPKNIFSKFQNFLN